MNKYAFVITSSISYLMGLNSILNAFDYYEHTDTDVILVCPDSMKLYYDYVKDKFSFPIKWESVQEWGDPTIIDEYSRVFAENDNCIWARWHYMTTLKDYETICCMDADMLLLSNIQHYFEIASKTGLILVPQFMRAGHWVEDYNYPPFKDKPDDLAKGMPLMNFIFMLNPKYHMDLVEWMWEHRNKTNPSDEMYLFNKATYVLNKLDRILELPGGIWLASDYMWHATTLWKGGQSKIGILTPSPAADKIMVMHGRYWHRALTKAELERHKDYPEMKKHIYENARLVEIALDHFNYHCKVTFKEIRELSPLYAQHIDGYEGVHY